MLKVQLQQAPVNNEKYFFASHRALQYFKGKNIIICQEYFLQHKLST